uniref:PUM-HD domain-containing protein n=1 Tax=Kalanchoe fedtschenkoi TaxID=63787 RepID=A0A7N0VDT7_KALFE
MTRMAEEEGKRSEGLDGVLHGVDLESLLEEIPDKVAWMDSQRRKEEELIWSSGWVQEVGVGGGDGGLGRSGVSNGGGLCDVSGGDDDAGFRFRKSWKCNSNGVNCWFESPDHGISTQSDGYVGGNGSPVGWAGYGFRDGTRSQMLVGGGALYSSSVFKPGLADGRSMNEGFGDEEGLCRYLSRMGVRDDGVDYLSEFNCRGDPYVFNDNFLSVANDGYGDFRNGLGGNGVAAVAALHSGGYSGFGGVGGGGIMNPALSRFQKGHVSDNVFQPQFYTRRSCTSFPMGYNTLPVGRHNATEQVPFDYHPAGPLSNLSNTFSGVSTPDALYSAQKSGMNFNPRDGILEMPKLQVMHQRDNLNYSSELRYGLTPCNSKLPLNARIPRGGIQDINREGSFILQGEGMSLVSNRNVECSRRRMKGSYNKVGGVMLKGKHTHHDRRLKMLGSCERNGNQQMASSFVIPQKIGSLAEVQGYLYYVAKDQSGCRFLQDIIEQRNLQAIQVIFDEIIEHIVELMINTFGNYFMQKLLDVCTEEQRTRILHVVTREPGEFVRVSVNDHGTRVIQKLIETVTTSEQKLKIVSALEPGFYTLIKDSNGTHVIDRCLHCFTNEDNKFIFVAAIECCIDIATDQSGCFVLQKCIGHSTGEYRDRLIAEITNNAFLLAQDAFGNYVVQFILDLKNPRYTSRLISQFRGNYVRLAMQKCGSHVVERCLSVFNNHSKSQIIHEMLSFNHFEQLLQDPHANYVIQTALQVSEGAIHHQLVQKIEQYRSISRHSPYSKRIFSSKKKK